MQKSTQIGKQAVPSTNQLFGELDSSEEENFTGGWRVLGNLGVIRVEVHIKKLPKLYCTTRCRVAIRTHDRS